MGESIAIRTFVGGEQVSREQVRAWEARRAEVVLTKLAGRLGSRAFAELAPEMHLDDLLSAPLDAQRSALSSMKTRLGHAGVYAVLERDLAISERMTRTGVALSRGRTKHAVTRLEVPGYSAERFAAWFTDLTATNAETDMVDACPDHYLLRALPDGRQEVVETTGGSPLATRFLIDYDRTEALTIPVDPRYPQQIAGQALLDDDLVIGGVRHQFHDRHGTMEALLTVQFPASLPARFIHQHRWHLAVEFSNWIIAAAPAASTS
ncbi:hypothetical protein [Nocardia abscessus]|uniref:hypothetical protein n=1 Tax=Nocardia abscessus TaxID=120957 RepID=UPI002455879F|nr:hypothetical protein [Nocardia abscessus]